MDQEPAIKQQVSPANPSTPAYTPSSMHLTPYHQPSDNSDGNKLDLAQLSHFLANDLFDSLTSIAVLKQTTVNTASKLEETRIMTGNDLRYLQGQIEALTSRFQARTDEGQNDAVTPSQSLKVKLEITTNGTDMEEVMVKPEDVVTAALKQCRNPFETLKSAMNDFDPIRMAQLSSEERLDQVVAQPKAGQEREVLDTPTHRPQRRSQLDFEVKRQAAKETTKSETKVSIADVKANGVHPPLTPPHSRKEGSSYTSCSDREAETASKAIDMPLAIRELGPFTHLPTNIAENAESFSFEMLQRLFLGDHWSPGFYFITPGRALSLLSCRAYWLLDAAAEPYLPSQPGQHGAKLTAFFNDTDEDDHLAPVVGDYMLTPTFISSDGGKTYRYFGNYSQHRFSDKLDYDRMARLPEHVKRFWAQQLASPGRPEWVTRRLIEHFWPKPLYCGPIPTDSTINTPATKATGEAGGSEILEKRVTRALDEYAKELREWKKEAEMKASLLSEHAVYDAFAKADADEYPGLRLWWEYLQCVQYDQGFYDVLCNVKYKRLPVMEKLEARAAELTIVRRKAESDRSGRSVVEKCSSRPHLRGVRPWEQQQSSATTTPKQAAPAGTNPASAGETVDCGAVSCGASSASTVKRPHKAAVEDGPGGPAEKGGQAKGVAGDLDAAKQMQQQSSRAKAGKGGPPHRLGR